MSCVPQCGTKRCRRCNIEKPVTEYRVFRMSGDIDREYRRCWCMTCEQDYSRAWRIRHPGYHATKSRYYRSL